MKINKYLFFAIAHRLFRCYSRIFSIYFPGKIEIQTLYTHSAFDDYIRFQVEFKALNYKRKRAGNVFTPFYWNQDDFVCIANLAFTLLAHFMNKFVSVSDSFCRDISLCAAAVYNTLHIYAFSHSPSVMQNSVSYYFHTSFSG